MSTGKGIRFPEPPKPPPPSPPPEKVELVPVENLHQITQEVIDNARELIEFVDTNRAEAELAGIDTIAIELSGMIEGGGLHRVLDTLKEAVLKKRPVELRDEGPHWVRRAEGLVAEASSRISKHIGNVPAKLGQPAEEKPAVASSGSLLWVPFVVIGVVTVAAVVLVSMSIKK